MPVRRILVAAACTALFAVSLGAPALSTAVVSNPNDPYFRQGDQWSLTGATSSIGAPAAWCVASGAGIVVADVDTGADFGHPDLAGKLVAGAAFLGGSGQKTGSGQSAVQDDNGHGTMTTGLIVAHTDNGVGIAGVAPSASALVVKALDSNGSGYWSDISAAIEWATDHGARVMNLSLGSDKPLTGDASGMPAAIDYAYSHGVAVALAAGNNSLPLTDYQVSQIDREALVVGAVGRTGQVAWYSTSGVGVNVYAPGGDDTDGSDTHGEIVSTHTGKSGYAIGEGTSFAAPQAAGVLALLMSHGMTGPQARQRVLDTAVVRSGIPELDAAKALGSTKLCPSTVQKASSSAPPVATLGSPPRAPAASTASTPSPNAVHTSKSTKPAGSATPSVTHTPSAPDVALFSPAPARHGGGGKVAFIALGLGIGLAGAGVAIFRLRRPAR